MNDSQFLNNLVACLFKLEISLGMEHETTSIEEFSHALDRAWDWVLQNTQPGCSVLTPNFVSSINHTLLFALGYSEIPKLEDGKAWSTFVSGFEEEDISNIDCGGHCWILSQIIWGEHFKRFSCTTGWLCMNAYLIRFGYSPIYPDISKLDILVKSLSGSARETWDAENLRGLIGPHPI